MKSARAEADRFRVRLNQNEQDLGAQLGLRDALLRLEDRDAASEARHAERMLGWAVEAVVKGDDEAMHRLELALEERPEDTELIWAVAGGCRRAGRLTRAVELYLEHQRLVPDSPFTQFLIDACRGSASPDGAPAEYVKALGEEIAEHYEYYMADIDDGTPAIMAAAVKDTAGAAPIELADMGCGTGLVGQLIKPFVKRMVGVDISAPMLERAKALKIYDDVVESDAVSYLKSKGQGFNRVIASDMLCYCGDLKDFLAAAAGALRRMGMLIFTVEPAADDVELGYCLTTFGRYTHTPAHVARRAKEAGLKLESEQRVRMRKEDSGDVFGLLYVFRKK